MADNSMEKCVICLEELNDKIATMPNCIHKIHTSCLIKLVKSNSNKCPSCHKELLYDKTAIINGILDISNMNLTNFDYLNRYTTDELNSIKLLHCNNNNITCFDGLLLPNLIGLYCNNNKITNFIGLPDKLVVLDCSNNQIKNFKDLSGIDLKLLYCEYNQLTSFVGLASTNIEMLFCSNNKITSFLGLPAQKIKVLHFLNNRIYNFDGLYAPVLEEIAPFRNPLADTTLLKFLHNKNIKISQLTRNP
jgi:hypothetical protein